MATHHDRLRNLATPSGICTGPRRLTVAQIARNVSLDARTVRRWLDEPRFRARATAARPSKLDPYKDYIVRLLEHHRYSAVQILQRLREAGYDAGSRS